MTCTSFRSQRSPSTRAQEAIDLEQPPGDIVVLSFADSDLGALAAAHRPSGGRPVAAPRLAAPPAPSALRRSLRREDGRARRASSWCAASAGSITGATASSACGGLPASGVKLAVLPGDDRPDPRLAAFATVPQALCDELDAYFQAGGVDNMRRLLARIGAEIGETDAVSSRRARSARLRVDARI